MTHRRANKKNKLMLLSVAAMVFLSSNALASETLKQRLPGKLEYVKYSKDFKIRGWKVGKGIYWGQAKIAGDYGVGIVVERKGYSWGINNRGIGFLKRF